MKKLNTIKLELCNEKDVYIIYEKLENGKYECSVYVSPKDEADLQFDFGTVFPQETETGIRTTSTEEFEEDICQMIKNYYIKKGAVLYEN